MAFKYPEGYEPDPYLNYVDPKGMVLRLDDGLVVVPYEQHKDSWDCVVVYSPEGPLRQSYPVGGYNIVVFDGRIQNAQPLDPSTWEWSKRVYGIPRSVGDHDVHWLNQTYQGRLVRTEDLTLDRSNLDVDVAFGGEGTVVEFYEEYPHRLLARDRGIKLATDEGLAWSITPETKIQVITEYA